MKPRSIPSGQVSVLFISVLFSVISGCAGYRIHSGYDMPVSDKYAYFVKGEKLMFRIENVTRSEGVLTGKMVINNGDMPNHRAVIFIASDRLMNISSDMVLSVPLQNISRVETLQISTQMSIVFVLGSALVVLFTLSALTFRLNPWDY